MATPYTGKTFYTSPGPNYMALRGRMSRFLSGIPEGEAVGTWRAVEFYLGRDEAVSMGSRKARHACYRLFKSAEKEGFIRRLPTRVVSTAPQKRRGRLVRKELAWLVTGDGLGYVASYRTESEL